MTPMGWLRRWPIATMLAAVIIAQSAIIVMFAVRLAASEQQMDQIHAEIVEVAVAAERRAVEAQERGERNLDAAMVCLTGMLAIPPDGRSDDLLYLVCPPALIDIVRDRLP